MPIGSRRASAFTACSRTVPSIFGCRMPLREGGTCERQRGGAKMRPPRILSEKCLREKPLSDPKNDESFKVVDRRLFTPEGEFRKDVAEQQDREQESASSVSAAQAARNAVPAKDPIGGGIAAKPAARDAAPNTQPTASAAKRSPAFENLVRSLGQNAAMLLGGYAAPRTGQPMLDLEGAREMIDMLDALREKTMGNLAPEEDTLVLDILGNLKLAFMEMTKAAAAAAMPQEKAKSRP